MFDGGRMRVFCLDGIYFVSGGRVLVKSVEK